jgi:alpha-N-acetylglucosaminidase
MSHTGDNLGPPAALPLLEKPVRIEAWARYRYALNYCTYNYTMSFYSWEDWEHELDWMALSGVNLMLSANGEEAVWRNTLRRLGYSDADIARFIPGPGYTAWWLMGNLEGWGGPMSQAMIERRSDTQRRILGRMRGLGIEPVLPGFYGMVPADLGKRLSAHVIDQGRWSSFRRPGILDPTDPAFPRIAALYYSELAKLYGTDIHFFSGDPFHEGGVTEGVDLGKAGVAIQAAMNGSFPGSVWVLQGWLDNPRKELIAQADKPHVLVQELAGEHTENWETRHAYEGTPFLWCCINNYGERPGMHGKLQRYADEVFRARGSDVSAYLYGVGIMPEGIANNPVSSDLVLELGWRSEHVDVSSWIQGYQEFRYGDADPSLGEAWSLLLKTVYGDDGDSENVLLARPASPVTPVSTWGTLKIGYDPALFARAAELFSRPKEKFKEIETYNRDLTDITIQELSNQAYGVATQMDAAIQSGDLAAYVRQTKRFEEFAASSEATLRREPECREETYRAKALRYGANAEEKEACLRDAEMLVTYWGGDDRNADQDHDYAFKAWSGMMTRYYLARWKLYFDFRATNWGNPGARPPDYFSWERAWVDENTRPGTETVPR